MNKYQEAWKKICNYIYEECFEADLQEFNNESGKCIQELVDKATPKKVNCFYKVNFRFYCPSCGKQQRNTYKNRREGCYCERCGQLIAPFEES